MLRSLKQYSILSLSILLFSMIVAAKSPVFATRLDLIAPSGTLQRGQSYNFTIDIDTQGESLSSITTGLKYETQYLELEGVTPGNSFSVISTQNVSDGKITITGTNDQPFSGSGVFAYAKFKIIATAPGETQVCALWQPNSNPTNTPVPSENATNTPAPATKLAKTGITKIGRYSQIVGIFLIVASIIFVLIKKFS